MCCIRIDQLQAVWFSDRITQQSQADQAQPSIEILKKIALAFNVTADWLIFEEGERALPNNLQLKFEAVSQMSEEDQRTIQSLIDGMILKHTANQLGKAG